MTLRVGSFLASSSGLRVLVHLRVSLDPDGIPGELLVSIQRHPPLNEGSTDMDATPLFTTATEIAQRIAAVEAIDWEAYLFDQVGDYDAIAPFVDRDSYPGPD
jgi:hypothetical protein